MGISRRHRLAAFTAILVVSARVLAAEPGAAAGGTQPGGWLPLLLGHLERMIQLEMRQDPRFPEFHRSMDMLCNVLPADTPRVTPEMRRREIAVRHAHIRERWRNC